MASYETFKPKSFLNSKALYVDFEDANKMLIGDLSVSRSVLSECNTWKQLETIMALNNPSTAWGPPLLQGIWFNFLNSLKRNMFCYDFIGCFLGLLVCSRGMVTTVSFPHTNTTVFIMAAEILEHRTSMAFLSNYISNGVFLQKHGT